jgi:hypothetical protein
MMDAIGEIRTEARAARQAKADEWGVPVTRVKISYVSGSIGSFEWAYELLPEPTHDPDR